MHEEVLVKLKGIKALLYCVSEVECEVFDMGYGLMLLTQEMEECIDQLEKVN
ncbi:hypothetical protein [Clostridium cellulovorans]|uniref:Isochorismatase hydrolase n=1 Tax=Clostridium cellulovorans (strain ATCC 35296 / DSM 3052 / OCM 3 / 743B) TaxID=573061 RepID=D9SLP3_CLOC7|nr:hypothetical protein [Clostridium cellulovorans]ADL53680.1 isochorismatase hydrolase [Clostridium cellulovorans 743B]